MAARFRIGDADRDRLAVLLREHFTAGRLTMDELDRRLGVVLTAEYANDAAVVFTDLPSLDLPSLDLPSAAASGARRVRGRHNQSTGPGDGWVPTSERFRDPSSGTIMRVWVDPADDSRHYVPDA
ncbi:MAG TPA: DUF1707 domain-containing protein [Streptosporangiaceae bacterium]|nr:DUF1707 domain-containing protein [Streptosporangiaceae bacterium]